MAQVAKTESHGSGTTFTHHLIEDLMCFIHEGTEVKAEVQNIVSLLAMYIQQVFTRYFSYNFFLNSLYPEIYTGLTTLGMCFFGN